jgi:hypothetical protein
VNALNLKASYHKHVESKMTSYDESKIVIDINDITMTEKCFVESFEPEGFLHSSAIATQCSIWNACCHERIFLQQKCVASTFVKPIFFVL